MCKSRADLHEHVEADVFETHVHKLIREVPPNLLKEIFLLLLIIITRPKPAYGRQGLAGLWGQDTDEVSTFFGVLNVSLCSCGAQLGFKPTWDH